MSDLIIGNVTVSHKNKLYRLNDLHKAAGGEDRFRPSRWQEIDSTKEFIEVCRKKVMTAGTSLQNQDVVLTIKGNSQNRGTYVCKELVYHYAMWVSPDFYWEVIRAYDQLVNHSYQHDAALERFRKVMLLEKPSEWQLLYTDDFYKPIMRLFGWKFEGHKGGLPAVVGLITRQWIYNVIVPEEIMKEIDENRESEKVHQWFTDGGKQKLIHQIAMVAGIAKTCRTYNEFKIKAGCVFNDSPLQLEMF